jgi:hypothetical protein
MLCSAVLCCAGTVGGVQLHSNQHVHTVLEGDEASRSHVRGQRTPRWVGHLVVAVAVVVVVVVVVDTVVVVPVVVVVVVIIVDTVVVVAVVVFAVVVVDVVALVLQCSE